MKRKKCTRCSKTRLIKFYTLGQGRCKKCRVDALNERYDNMTDKEKFEEYVTVKKWYYKKYYKITFEEYIEKVEQQNYLCAMCGVAKHYETHTFKGFKNNVLARREKNKSSGCSLSEWSHMRAPKCNLNVDHDHDTGKVRDLLCSDCNSAYGLMHENPQTIKGMLDYHEKWRKAA